MAAAAHCLLRRDAFFFLARLDLGARYPGFALVVGGHRTMMVVSIARTTFRLARNLVVHLLKRQGASRSPQLAGYGVDAINLVYPSRKDKQGG
jgi:hypothetical protein